MVVLLVEEVGVGLLAAGSILAASQVADRTGDASPVLILLAAIMAGACAMVVTVGPAWPLPVVAVIFTCLGVVVGHPTLSFAHDAFGGYAAGFIALAVAALLGGALAFKARRCP